MIKQTKWFRNFSESTINILDTIYTLRATENKRELIRDSCGKIIGTRPYLLNNCQLVNRERFILFYLPLENFYNRITTAKDFVLVKSINLPEVIYVDYHYSYLYLPKEVLYLTAPNVYYLPVENLNNRLPTSTNFILVSSIDLPEVIYVDYHYTYLYLPKPVLYLESTFKNNYLVLKAPSNEYLNRCLLLLVSIGTYNTETIKSLWLSILIILIVISLFSQFKEDEIVAINNLPNLIELDENKLLESEIDIDDQMEDEEPIKKDNSFRNKILIGLLIILIVGICYYSTQDGPSTSLIEARSNEIIRDFI